MSDSMNYKKLLLKYINHVGICEGTTFLGDHNRNEWDDTVEFTDEEWEALKELDEVDYIEEFVGHSCSCHVKGEGPCIVCQKLGCEVFDFNRVAMPQGELWVHDHTQPIMTLPQGDAPSGS